ncbi:MAG: GyrI-like domain-containing protein [Reichenbachiella sp.]|uniref:GyrI-like domain-containing protein n=1 Tax=Reichenbachiella sp. TaxID=2184521 RepID=UPI003265487B
MQEPQIVDLMPKKLIGFSKEMSYASNLTGMLWGQFMPRRREIQYLVSEDKFSLQVFNQGFDWYSADEHTSFTKWATMEVSKVEGVPDGMKQFDLVGGKYAVFTHKGLASDFPITLQYILQEWLPNSEYDPDYSRPQYEVLGDKYINQDPNSEEEIWFPIVKKSL